MAARVALLAGVCSESASANRSYWVPIVLFLETSVRPVHMGAAESLGQVLVPRLAHADSRDFVTFRRSGYQVGSGGAQSRIVALRSSPVWGKTKLGMGSIKFSNLAPILFGHLGLFWYIFSIHQMRFSRLGQNLKVVDEDISTKFRNPLKKT